MFTAYKTLNNLQEKKTHSFIISWQVLWIELTKKFFYYLNITIKIMN